MKTIAKIFSAVSCLWLISSVANGQTEPTDDHARAGMLFRDSISALARKEPDVAASLARQSARLSPTPPASVIAGIYSTKIAEPYDAFSAIRRSMPAASEKELIRTWNMIYDWSLPAAIAADTLCEYRAKDLMGSAACILNDDEKLAEIFEKYFGDPFGLGAIVLGDDVHAVSLDQRCPDNQFQYVPPDTRNRCKARTAFLNYKFPEPPDVAYPTPEQLEEYFATYWPDL